MLFIEINKKIVAAMLLAVSLCANTCLKSAENRGEKRKRESTKGDFVGSNKVSKAKLPRLVFLKDGASSPLQKEPCGLRDSGKRPCGTKVTKPKQYTCTSKGCGFVCDSLRNVSSHTARIHPPKSFMCDIAGCGYGSSRLYNIKKHKEAMHPGK